MKSDDIDLKYQYMQLEQIEKQINSAKQNIQNIDQDLLRLDEVKEQLSELKTQKNDSETLIPISDGVYVKAKVTDFEKLYVNVGAGIVADKSYEDVFELIEKQKANLLKQSKNLRDMIVGLEAEAFDIEKRLENRIKE